MIKNMMQKLKDMKMRYKLMLIYFCIGFFPLLILGVYCFSVMSDLMLQQERESSLNYVNQIMNSLESNVVVYDNLSDYISYDENVANAISYNYTSKYELYKTIVSTIDPVLTSVQYFHTSINEVTIYAREDIVSHDTTFAPITDIQNESWYELAINNNRPVWIVEDDEVISVRKMPVLDRKGMVGILCIRIDYDQMFEAFNNNTTKNYGLFIADRNGKLLYEKQNYENSNQNEWLEFEEFLQVKDTNKYTVVEKTLDSTGWDIYYYRHASLMYSTLKPVGFLVALIVVLCVLGSAIALMSTSQFLVGRIEKLQHNIKLVEEGNYDITITSEDKDEVGSLVRGFTRMIDRIKFLIEEVYESRLLQKNYEMRALQQQINPHFLYNTLSMINFMALESDRHDISKITLALSDFYRTSLNKGRNTCSIEDELKNMNAYLDIQIVMHDYEFDIDIEIEESILEYETLNLILQPIVENAILHGIDLLEDRRGVIKIYATKNNGVVYIMVEDNGVGMDKETCIKMLCENSKGYGMRNVNERIKLIYGEEYGLYIESVPGEGTVVTVKLPERKFKQEI